MTNKHKHTYFSIILLLLAASVEAGIDPKTLETPPVFGNYQAKGFLSDYSKIKPTEGNNKVFAYRNNKLDKSKYKKIMIDPISISTKRNVWPRADSPELDDLVVYFHKAIVKAVGDIYPVVENPGPDVLRLRIAVTDLEANDPGISLLTLVVPFMWLGEASLGAAQGEGSTPFAGQAVVEMETLDSTNNTQIAAYIERRVGKKYNWDQGLTEGLSSYMKAFFTWAYTEEAFDHWADLLREDFLGSELSSKQESVAQTN